MDLVDFNFLVLTFLPPLCCACAFLQLQSSVTEFEFSQEEYRQLQVEFWSKFYACCLQYQEALSMPLGLTVSQHTNMVCLLKKVTPPRQIHSSYERSRIMHNFRSLVSILDFSGSSLA